MTALLYLDQVAGGLPYARGESLGLTAWREQWDRRLPFPAEQLEPADPAGCFAALRAREEDAIRRRAATVAPEGMSPHQTVLLAHQNATLRWRLRRLLSRAGLHVIDTADDVVEALAAIVVVQPAVLVTSELVSPGAAFSLVERSLDLSPVTYPVVQVEDPGRCDKAVEAGAVAVLSSLATTAQLYDVVTTLLPVRDVSTHRGAAPRDTR